MVVITNMGTAPAIRSSYNGKEMKSVWLLNTENLCQKAGLSPYFCQTKMSTRGLSVG